MPGVAALPAAPPATSAWLPVAGPFCAIANEAPPTSSASAGIDTNNPNTWKIGGHDLVEVANSAFATLREISRIEVERPPPLAPNVDA